jgi:hypothetical protein
MEEKPNGGRRGIGRLCCRRSGVVVASAHAAPAFVITAAFVAAFVVVGVAVAYVFWVVL